MSTTTKKTTAKKAAPKTTKAKARTASKAAKPKSAAPTSPVDGLSPMAETASPTIVNAPTAMIVGAAMRKKEIVDEVVLRSGLKKRDVKPIVETLLAVMGEAMAEGRELVVPPLGRVKVHKQKTTPKKKIFFSKVHQNILPVGGAEPSTSEADI